MRESFKETFYQGTLEILPKALFVVLRKKTLGEMESLIIILFVKGCTRELILWGSLCLRPSLGLEIQINFYPNPDGHAMISPPKIGFL